MNGLAIKMQIKYFRVHNRIENTFFPRNLNLRYETFPFISCDSYALRCDLAFSRELTLEELELKLEGITSDSSIFIPTRFAGAIADYLTRRNLIISKIVLGDDDQSPHIGEIRNLAKVSKNLFGINVVQVNEHIYSIPIGLESPSYRSGGRLKDYRKNPINDSSKRALSFLVAWNASTNLLKREYASNVFRKTPDTYFAERRIPAQVVHKLMRKSLFVPCPAGNGLDTHRIWESLFLGSVPIILYEDNFAALDGWPVLVVKSWQEVSELPRYKIEKLYQGIVWEPERVLEKSKEILKDIQL